MKTNITFRRGAVCLGLLGLIGTALAQQRPTLDLPASSPQGGIRLTLHGEAGTNYALEISRSLNAWLPLASLTATNGQADFHYLPATNSQAIYFRARVAIPLPPINLSVQTDTNDQTVTLITPNDGGTLSLTDVHGVSYVLVVPPQAIPDSQILTMTVVTNLGGLPFAAGALGAISFAPDSLSLAVPAQLFIQFPTNPPIDVSKVAGYGFNGDGSYLRLVPTLPWTNGVMLPLTVLSGLGCSVVTFQEIVDQAQRAASETVSLASAGADGKLFERRRGAYYDSCYPAEKTRAVFVGKGIENAFNAASQAAGARIVANSQLPGADQLTIGDLNLTDDFNNFYRDNLNPYASEFQTNCALASAMLPYILGIERQAQLLGVETQVPDSFLNLCALVGNCAQKIDECCKTRGASQEALTEILGLSRQAQLMGCSEDPWQLCPDCFPGWYGTVKYQDTASDSQTSDPDLEIDSQYELTATFVSPTNLLGSPSGQGYYGLTGTLSGPAEGKNRFHSHQIFPNTCGSYADNLKTSAVSTNASAFFQLVWSITNTPPGPPQNGLLLLPDAPTLQALSSVDALNTSTDVSSGLDSDGNCITTTTVDTSHSADDYPLVQLFFNSTSITGTINDVTGTYSTNWTEPDGTLWTRSLSWDLHRKQ